MASLGLGDNFAADGMKHVGEVVESVNPGTFIYQVQLGQDPSSDRTASFYGNVTAQVEQVCEALAAHPILSTAPAIDALGFSQGGVFLRGYIERCNNPPVRSLVTYGSPHLGIAKFKACGDTDFLCQGAMALLKLNTWSTFVQGKVVPAQYYRDPTDYDRYLENSNFLADINNERILKNTTYAENLSTLSNFVMIMFQDDVTLIPKETSWFQDVNGTDVTPLRDTKLYKEDWLGLRALDEKGALKFRMLPGDHMQIGEDSLKKTVSSYFGPYSKQFGQDEEDRISDEL
jgi:palmitoyl-protein thioesterase